MAYSLYGHQKDVESLLLQRSAILWWDCQTGKTRAVLNAFDQLWQRGGPRRLVVVCPAYARATWMDEMEVMGLGLPVLSLYGITKPVVVDQLRNERATKVAASSELGASSHHFPTLTILSWDTLGAWQTSIRSQAGSFVLALDESHEHVSNPATKRYAAANALGQFADRTWLLTGTIYRKSALDIFWQGRLAGAFRDLKAARFGENYCQRRFNPFRGYAGAWEYRGLKPGAELELARITPNLSRVHESDCFDIPAVRRIANWVDIGSGYQGGDDLEHLEAARSRLIGLKVKRCLEFIQDLPQRPLIVYGWHQEFVHQLAEAIPGSAFVTGETPTVKRAEIRQAFNAGRIPVLIANLKAFGLSVSLVRASHIIFGELHWDEVDHRQAEGRIHGPGQQAQHLTYTYLMVKNSVDEFIWRVKLGKGKAMDRLDKSFSERIVTGGTG